MDASSFLSVHGMVYCSSKLHTEAIKCDLHLNLEGVEEGDSCTTLWHIGKV